MEKIWHIDINGVSEGPYSVEELEIDRRITPDTLGWKEGYEQWIRLADIPELAGLFKNEDDAEVEYDVPATPEEEELILENRSPPPYMPIIIIFTTILIVYLLVRFYMQ